MGFPVWSTAVSVAGTVKQSPGWINVPVSCAGVTVHPGDAVVADDDGVVVVAAADVDRVVEAAVARESYEEEIRRRLLAGETSMDIADLRPVLDRLGVRYLDGGSDM